jgi:conjugative transfer signal peptidase TraF
MMERSVPDMSGRRRRNAALALLGSSVGLDLILAALGYGGFRINLTPSQPIGIWRIVPEGRPVGHGDVVFACPPMNPVMIEARRRGYLRSGLCPGGVAPVIKTVVAVAGQSVSIGEVIVIDGGVLAHSRLLGSDVKGRSLAADPGGVLPAGFVHLHSDYPGSFDSRYFGPVARTNILGRAQEVWTFEVDP